MCRPSREKSNIVDSANSIDTSVPGYTLFASCGFSVSGITTLSIPPLDGMRRPDQYTRTAQADLVDTLRRFVSPQL